MGRLIIEESVHVSFGESFQKNVGKGMSFHDIGVSLHDILNEVGEGIDQLQTKSEKVEDDDHKEEKKESLVAVDNFLRLGEHPKITLLIIFLEISQEA